MQQPILVVIPDPAVAGAAGASYLGELLRVEGLNWLTEVDEEAFAALAAAGELPPIVLVAAGELRADTATLLAVHVRAGARLLAARPCAFLLGALGLPPAPTMPAGWASRYVMLDPAAGPVAALPWVATGVQFIGAAIALPKPNAAGDTADPASTATALAWLAPFPGQRSNYPAALAVRPGAGLAVLFAFDPAASALGQQQGRPEQASDGILPDFDGDEVFRPSDLFFGQLDPALRDVPQADLQRTLLLRAMEWLTADWPVPRLWRFPGGAPAAVLLDGDSDSMSGDDLALALDTCDRHGAPFATYLMREHFDVLTPQEATAAGARGHRFGLHPWAGQRPTAAALAAVVEADATRFAARFGYRARLHRGHWLVWPGWIDHARSLAAAGLRLEASFAAGRHFQGGYVNGSGLPARFMAPEGRLLDLWEQATTSTDDGWLLEKSGLPALTLDGAVARTRHQIDAAVARDHVVVHPYFHPVLLRGGHAVPVPTLPWLEAVLVYGRSCDLPFLDAERWLDWHEARRGIQLSALQHDTRSLRCDLTAASAAEQVTVLVPLPAGAGANQEGHATVSLLLDGRPVEPDAQPHPATLVRHGRAYAAITLSLRAGETRRLAIAWAPAASPSKPVSPSPILPL